MAAAWPPRTQPWGSLRNIQNVEKSVCPMSSRNHVAINTSHWCLLLSKPSTLGRWAKQHFLSPFSAQTLAHITTLRDAHYQVYLTAEGTGSSHGDRGGCWPSPSPPAPHPHTHTHKPLSAWIPSWWRKESGRENILGFILDAAMDIPMTWGKSTFPSFSIHREEC